ncbi:MAG TPA: flavin reductase, partial [Candidatus Limnocylindria bacterium]|nr:flavin reductase [Candidatus Limnocylindria bacterium]
VQLVPHRLAAVMNQTSTMLPYGESEFAAFGVAATPSQLVRPPRVADAPVAFECTLDRIIPVGEGPLAANVVFGRIVLAHVSDDVLGADGLPDPAKLDLVGRLGGENFTRTTDRFALKRPDR